MHHSMALALHLKASLVSLAVFFSFLLFFFPTVSFSSKTPTNWRAMYENLPQKASTYRGRVLLSREVREHLPIGREEVRFFFELFLGSSFF